MDLRTRLNGQRKFAFPTGKSLRIRSQSKDKSKKAYRDGEQEACQHLDNSRFIGLKKPMASSSACPSSLDWCSQPAARF